MRREFQKTGTSGLNADTPYFDMEGWWFSVYADGKRAAANAKIAKNCNGTGVSQHSISRKQAFQKMTNHRVISIRLNNKHFTRIKNDAQTKGYETISEYVRTSLITDDLSLNQKIGKIYEALFNSEPQKIIIKERPLMYYFKNGKPKASRL